MGSLFDKNYRLCCTCVFWQGQRTFNTIPQTDADGTSFASCSQPRSAYTLAGQQVMATQNGCEHYELHPLLR